MTRHFHTEHCHRKLRTHRRVLCEIHGERGLSHGRPTGDNHQISFLQAGSQRIEIMEAARNARDTALGFKKLFNTVHRLGKQSLDSLESKRATSVGV